MIVSYAYYNFVWCGYIAYSNVVYFRFSAYICLILLWQMSTIPPFHIGYADRANRGSHNIAFVAWVIFSPNNEFMDSRGIFLNRATNNIVEYEVVIAFMTNAYALGILSLVVRLDSELVIS